MEKPAITPELKVAALLDHYPELENTLIEMAPEFEKLKNPFLRKTIARVTTLKQASAIAKISAEVMVNQLRLMVGQQLFEGFAGIDDSFEGNMPEWVLQKEPFETYDASPVIKSGGMPLCRIMNDIDRLQPGQLYLLISPMLPAPLLEKARDKGFKTWSEKKSDNQYHNWITR